MSNNILKPNISDDFTIDDIHKIREYNYEITKNMSTEDWCKYYNDSLKEFNLLMGKKKAI